MEPGLYPPCNWQQVRPWKILKPKSPQKAAANRFFKNPMAFRGPVLILGSVSPFWRVKTKASYLSLHVFVFTCWNQPSNGIYNASSSGSFSSTTQPRKVAGWGFGRSMLVKHDFIWPDFWWTVYPPISIEQWKNPWLLGDDNPTQLYRD